MFWQILKTFKFTKFNRPGVSPNFASVKFNQHDYFVFMENKAGNFFID